ncbi:hypothetical protein M9H77_17327 [Catharanthus roseus]|uniref:Uncharacterized protein n=1 Tax=Catharanthus roseus TaxID=4058 RepID=A0ACC0B4A4_CATRO|nr:hypothetical protein M9H77_17327 [Catharanthus roseus]
MSEKQYKAGPREEGYRLGLEDGGGLHGSGLRECASGGPEEWCGPALESGGGQREGIAGGPWEGAFGAGFAGRLWDDIIGSGPWVGGLREGAGGLGLLFTKLPLSCILCCLELKTCSPKL